MNKWQETKFFVTCFRFNREKNWVGDILIERLLGQLEKNGIEPSDLIKKQLESRGDLLDSRCFGWYAELDDAKMIIESNAMDIHECCFTYAVVEEMKSGPYQPAKAVAWYKWDHDEEAYLPIDCPEELENRYGFCF